MFLVNNYLTLTICEFNRVDLVLRPRMIKNVIKYFLPLWILLLSGSNQLLSYDQGYGTPSDFIENIKGAGLDNSSIVNHIKNFVSRSSFIRACEKNKLKGFDIEEEEDELPSSKKNSKDTKCSTSFFYDKFYEYSYYYSKSTIAFCKQLPFILNNERHIFFQVFRI